MFERYTEPAKRVIFYSRYMAAQTGSPKIETEHLLLGLLREENCFAAQMLKEGGLELESTRESLAKKASLLPKSCAVFASIVADSQRILLSK